LQGLLDDGERAERLGGGFEVGEPVVGAERAHGPHQRGDVGARPGLEVAQRAERHIGPLSQRFAGDALGDAQSPQRHAQMLFELLIVHSQKDSTCDLRPSEGELIDIRKLIFTCLKCLRNRYLTVGG
jgi:hypothetical protein